MEHGLVVDQQFPLQKIVAFHSKLLDYQRELWDIIKKSIPQIPQIPQILKKIKKHSYQNVKNI